MAKVVTENTNYTNIANAIREKTGKNESMLPSQMADEILSISGGGSTTESCVVGVDDPSSVTISSSSYFPDYLIKKIDLTDVNITMTSYKQMFYNFKNLKEIVGLNTLDTSNVTTMESMFQDCYSLTSLDLSSFTIGSSVTIPEMFSYCSKLSNLVINTIELGYDCSGLFRGCRSLNQLDSSKLVERDLKKASYMFSEVPWTTADFSNWWWEPEDISYMFSDCSKLISVYFGGTDFSGCYNTDDIFKNCTSLQEFDFGSSYPWFSNENSMLLDFSLCPLTQDCMSRLATNIAERTNSPTIQLSISVYSSIQFTQTMSDLTNKGWTVTY